MQTAVKSAVAALPHSSTLPRHWHALIAVIGGLLLFSVSSASYRTTCVQMVRNSVYNTASPQPDKYCTNATIYMLVLSAMVRSLTVILIRVFRVSL